MIQYQLAHPELKATLLHMLLRAGVVKIQDLPIFNPGRNKQNHKFLRILYSEVNKMQYFQIIHIFVCPFP